VVSKTNNAETCPTCLPKSTSGRPSVEENGRIRTSLLGSIVGIPEGQAAPVMLGWAEKKGI